jgi:uncharacterized protein
MIPKIFFLLIVSLLAGHAAAQVNALPPTRHILVYGDAHARAIPDRFKIGVHFEAIDVDPDVARRNVETNFKDVLAKLKASGVAEREIVATSLQIDSRQRYDQKLQEQVFVGTAVTRSLTARFMGQADLEAFLAKVKTSQGLRISDVTTELSSEPSVRKALREKSIVSTREKAEVIAKAYGSRLGALYSVSDVAPQFEYGIREGDWPELYEWRSAGNGGELDRIEVTGSRVAPAPVADAAAQESFQTGYMSFEDRIYAVFLLAD